MGREEEIAYAREPTASRSRAAPSRPRTRSTTTSGAAPRRASGSRTSPTPPTTTSSSSSRGPRRRRTSRRSSSVGFEAGVPVSLDGERLGLVDLLERAAEIGCRHGVGIVDHIEDRIVGLKVRDIYEVPAATILLTAHAELERLVVHDPPEPVQGRARPQVGLPGLRGAVVGAAADRPRRLHGRGQRAGHRHDRPEALQGLAAGWSRASRPTRSTTRALATFETSGGLFSQQASPGFIELWSLQSRHGPPAARARRALTPCARQRPPAG